MNRNGFHCLLITVSLITDYCLLITDIGMKTYEEINEKIAKGNAVVLTAAEVAELARTMKPKEIAKKVDVVTTGTFGAMCSSGLFVNLGHAEPAIRMERIEINGVPVCGGLAAVDTYIGATDTHPDNPAYGGAHLIEALLRGEELTLEAWGKGTDCYPRRHIKTRISIETVNETIMYNPRNAYQNYCVATNSGSQIRFTYMGTLLPNLQNAAFSTSGELSPLLNDPECRTIGMGTRIFLCGAQGYVAWNGTQFNTSKEVNSQGIPVANSRTLATIGELREMDPAFLKAVHYENYGNSLFVGIGIPVPILDEDLAHRVSIRNEQIETNIIDYGQDHRLLGRTNYAALQSGVIEIGGKRVRAMPVSSLSKAKVIAETLKGWIERGEFLLTEPVRPMPSDRRIKNLSNQ